MFMNTANPVIRLWSQCIVYWKSQANSFAGLNIPAAFKVVLIPETHVPIDSEEIYRAATGMMIQVTDRPLMERWLNRDWQSPAGDSGIYIRPDIHAKAPSRLYTQYIIWALNRLLLSMTLSGKYCQTTALLKYEDIFIGAIHVARRPPVGEHWNTEEPSASETSTQQALAYTNFEIRVSYGAKPIPRNLVYLTAIKAMGEACEKGLHAVVPGMFTTGIQEVIWKLIGMSQSEHIIEPGYSRMAVIKTLAKMVSEDHFSEAFVWAKVDGRAAGIGGFVQGKDRFTLDVTS
ncbi:MAG: hypothetical protein Q9168_000174 [Polycauliona sp. 1 TL-2023]